MSPEARAREIAYRRRLFEEKFIRRGENECWPWIAGQNQKGNGIFGIGSLARTATKPAHVVAWFFYRNPSYDLDNRDIFHRLCGASDCVNPRHMAVVGPDGLSNFAEVTRFIASRVNPAVAARLSAAAAEMDS
jgi:hypothetical protein